MPADIESKKGKNAKNLINKGVYSNRKLFWTHEISEVKSTTGTIRILSERTHHIISTELHFSCVSARWVSRMLSVEQKRMRLTISRDCVKLFEDDLTKFVERFLTTDETLVYYHTSEMKNQSKQWKRPGSPASKKAKVVL
ncbi:unnamed protein product [Euphydryas editha]|uniref:Uncharacterized protein n=1 Tax=Euphydryas editha TaxID=104508 RepID=A0AAU9V2E3_EUPED|nr:unnamed protein product [Euphydryas editha]